MKKIHIIYLVISLFCFTGVTAQQKNADAEYLKITKEYALNKDGSFDYHYRKEIKLLSYLSFHRLFGETFIVYNPEFQKLRINESYTVMADGKKIVTPENAFNEVLPSFARDVAAYNHLREMVVTHTGTEIGAVITLDYTITTAPGFQPFFFGMEEIGESVPVKDLTILVRIPEELFLQYRMLNNRMAPEITQLAGQKMYSWKFRNLPALPRSSHQDPERKELLQFSTARDMTWAYFSFVNQPAFKKQVGPEISRRVGAVLKEKKDAVDIALALQEIVIDEIRLVDIPLAHSGYKVRTPAEIWQSANATSLEKAILLSEMLIMANINATPVTTVPNGWFSRELGNLTVFDGYLVQVNPKKSGRMYLSVNRKQLQNLIYNLDDKTMIQLDGAVESMRTFQEKRADHVLQMDAKLKIDAEKSLSGKLDLRMEGIVNPYFSLYKDSSHVKSMITGDVNTGQTAQIKQSQLNDMKARTEVNLTPHPLKTNYSGYTTIDLPRYRTGFDAWNLVQFTGSDNTPVKLEHHLWESYTIQIELPDGWELVTPPADFFVKNTLGDMEIKIMQRGKIVTIKRSWELSSNIITTEDMEKFREMVVAWERPDWRRIMFRVK